MWTEGYGGFEEFSQVRGGCGLWLSGYTGDGMEFCYIVHIFHILAEQDAKTSVEAFVAFDFVSCNNALSCQDAAVVRWGADVVS